MQLGSLNDNNKYPLNKPEVKVVKIHKYSTANSDLLEIKKQYDNEGFAVVEVFERHEMNFIRSMVRELVSAPELENPRIRRYSALSEPDTERFPDNPFATYNVVNTPLAGDPWMSLLSEDRILTLVSAVLASDINFDMGFLRLRPPGLKINHAWHRDCEADAYTSQKAITALIYLSDMTAQNGATKVLPKSHLGIVGTDISQFPIDDDFAESEGLDVEVPAGCVLLLHGMAVHRGGWSSTEESTGAALFEYKSSDTYRRPDGDNFDLALCDLALVRGAWRFKASEDFTVLSSAGALQALQS